MKVVVIHKDGRPETITLTEPVQIIRGTSLNRLVTSTGMEHWFNADGTYDGWGMSVGNISLQDAAELIRRTQAERED